MSRVKQALKRRGEPTSEWREPSTVAFTPAWDMVAEPVASTLAQPIGAEGAKPRPVPLRESHGGERLVGARQAPSLASDQYSALAAGLYRVRESRSLRTIMIASACEGEGKSLTAANLALTFSRAYRQSVVLVDADLRRPTLHTMLGVENLAGLTEHLSAGRQASPVPVPLSDGLSLLSAGSPEPEPMSLLASSPMQSILRDMATNFEWVVVDTPPLASLPDASLLSRMVDGVLLVVRAGQTPLRLIEQALRVLGRDRILGIVLNRVDAQSVPRGYRRANRQRDQLV